MTEYWIVCAVALGILATSEAQVLKRVVGSCTEATAVTSSSGTLHVVSFDSFACRWRAKPLNELRSNAMVLYAEVIQMVDCNTAQLLFPSEGHGVKICKREEPYCFTYYEKNTHCDATKLDKEVEDFFPDCKSTRKQVALETMELDFLPTTDDTKWFTIKYKVFNCTPASTADDPESAINASKPAMTEGRSTKIVINATMAVGETVAVTTEAVRTLMESTTAVIKTTTTEDELSTAIVEVLTPAAKSTTTISEAATTVGKPTMILRTTPPPPVQMNTPVCCVISSIVSCSVLLVTAGVIIYKVKFRKNEDQNPAGLKYEMTTTIPEVRQSQVVV